MSILAQPQPEGPEGVLCATCGSILEAHWVEPEYDESGEPLWEGYWAAGSCRDCEENRKLTEEWWDYDQQLQREVRDELGLNS